MKFLFALWFTILAAFSASAGRASADQSPETVPSEICPRVLTAFDNLQLQQSRSADGTKCYLGIHPRDAFETLIYRDYLLTNDGLLMVFNSFAPDDRPDSAGAREFYFFPHEFKGFQWKTDGESLIVTGFQGLELKFSLKTAQITSISGAQIQVADKVIPANRGGVEILKFEGLFMDVGFMTGNAPSSRPNASSTWKNSHDQQCRLRNSDVFRYKGEDAYIKSGAELIRLIQTKCPQFKL